MSDRSQIDPNTIGCIECRKTIPHKCQLDPESSQDQTRQPTQSEIDLRSNQQHGMKIISAVMSLEGSVSWWDQLI